MRYLRCACLMFTLVLVASTASAAVILGPYEGSLDSSDSTMIDRLFRDGDPSTCGGGTVFPGTLSGLTIYDTYTFFNEGPADCITVTYSGSSSPNVEFLSAYAGSFDPANLATNYLGDSGRSSAGDQIVFSFMVSASSPFVIVASSVDNFTAGPYSFTVSGENIRETSLVPEPTTLALLGIGLVGVATSRRRRV